MGWLGWPPETAMSADVNAIQIAMEGRIESIRYANGLPPIPEKKPRFTYADFREFAKRHNAAREAKRQHDAAAAARRDKAREEMKSRVQ